MNLQNIFKVGALVALITGIFSILYFMKSKD